MSSNIQIPITGFTKILPEGIPRDHSIVLRGGPGTLRSSFAFSIMSGCASDGGKGLYVMTERRTDEMACFSLGVIAYPFPTSSAVGVESIRREASCFASSI